MRIADRVARLEAVDGAKGDHRRRLESDAAAFVDQIDRLAKRQTGTPGTLDEFLAAIRQSGSAFLIASFIGDLHATV